MANESGPEVDLTKLSANLKRYYTTGSYAIPNQTLSLGPTCPLTSSNLTCLANVGRVVGSSTFATGHDRCELWFLLEQRDLRTLPVEIGYAGQALESDPIAIGYHKMIGAQRKRQSQLLTAVLWRWIYPQIGLVSLQSQGREKSGNYQSPPLKFFRFQSDLQKIPTCNYSHGTIKPYFDTFRSAYKILQSLIL